MFLALLAMIGWGWAGWEIIIAETVLWALGLSIFTLAILLMNKPGFVIRWLKQALSIDRRHL